MRQVAEPQSGQNPWPATDQPARPVDSARTSFVTQSAIVAVLAAAYFGWVFQVWSPSFWTKGLANWLDPYFINYLLEHWFHSLTHLSDPGSPPMYYPAKDTLGYSHGLILYAPFYVLVRPFLAPFQAESVAMLVMLLLGTICLFALLRKGLNVGFVEALLLTAFFATSANEINGGTATWMQRASVFLIPPIALLGCYAFGTYEKSAGLTLSAVTGLLASLLLTQEFYTAAFAALFIALFSVALPLNSGREFVRTVRANRGRALAAGGGALAGLLIFLVLYLPAYYEHPAFPADQLASALIDRHPARWQSLNDVLRDLNPFDSRRAFVLSLAVGVLAWLPSSRVDRRRALFGVWLVSISILVLVIPVRLGPISLWTTLFAPVPGLSLIRDPTRIVYVYELVVVCAVALFLARLPRASFVRLAVMALISALIFVDWNPTRFDFQRDNAIFDNWVKAPINIDPTCRSFFVKGASPVYMSRSDNMWGLYAIDAMFIALDHDIPTLNGYSAWAPEHWQLANPQEPGYLRSVDDWIAAHHLAGVCQLDIDARTMTPHQRGA